MSAKEYIRLINELETAVVEEGNVISYNLKEFPKDFTEIEKNRHKHKFFLLLEARNLVVELKEFMVSIERIKTKRVVE